VLTSDKKSDASVSARDFAAENLFYYEFVFIMNLLIYVTLFLYIIIYRNRVT